MFQMMVRTTIEEIIAYSNAKFCDWMADLVYLRYRDFLNVEYYLAKKQVPKSVAKWERDGA